MLPISGDLWLARTKVLEHKQVCAKNRNGFYCPKQIMSTLQNGYWQKPAYSWLSEKARYTLSTRLVALGFCNRSYIGRAGPSINHRLWDHENFPERLPFGGSFPWFRMHTTRGAQNLVCTERDKWIAEGVHDSWSAAKKEWLRFASTFYVSALFISVVLPFSVYCPSPLLFREWWESSRIHAPEKKYLIVVPAPL